MVIMKRGVNGECLLRLDNVHWLVVVWLSVIAVCEG